jgi:hypothetical protein
VSRKTNGNRAREPESPRYVDDAEFDLQMSNLLHFLQAIRMGSEGLVDSGREFYIEAMFGEMRDKMKEIEERVEG